MSDGAGAEAWSYDALGRVLTSRRVTNNVTKDFLYTWNLDGSLASITYPSGQVVNYAYNAAGRALSAAGAASYASNATYAPHGALATLRHNADLFGFAWRERLLTYNNRLQPVTIKVDNVFTRQGSELHKTAWQLSYNFNHGVANNGNVSSIEHLFNPDRTQIFTYDELNRIDTARTQATTGSLCWGLDHGYDPWGNLLTIGAVTGYGACTQQLLSVAATPQNRVSGFSYDAAGNMTTYPGYGSYTYDAENRLTTTAGVTYTYDGDGRRVKKSNGNLYWYGAGSNVVMETDLSGNLLDEYMFFNGQRVARRRASDAAVFYFFSDHLGSSRIVTDSAGTVVEDSDFYPFGGERVVVDSLNNNYKFTGQERDTESGLDYFGARYYAPTLARFTIPDPLMASARLRNPQTWNRYSYVLNNPLAFIDPDGLEGTRCNNGDEACDPNAQRNQIRVRVVVFFSTNLSHRQLAAATGQLEIARVNLAKIGIKLEITLGSTRTVDVAEFIRSGGGEKGAVNLVFAAGADMGGLGSRSGMDGDKGGIFINMTRHGEEERVTQFEFLQLFTARFGNFDPSGGLNAIKDIGLERFGMMSALESTPTRMEAFDFLTNGALSRDIQFVRNGAKRFEVKPQNQEDTKPKAE